MAYNNNAYDLDRFAPRGNAVPKKAAQKKAVIKRFPQKQPKKSLKNSLAIKLIVAGAIVLLVCFNVYTRVEISNTQTAIANAQSQIEELRSEETRLNVQFENLVSYTSLEKQAEKLGMQKRSKSQIHYIDTSSDSYAEVINN